MLSDGEHQFLARQRIAHLATADRRAVPHVVPVCFAILDRTLYITIDEKPKRLFGTALKRLRNIAENPAVAVVRGDGAPLDAWRPLLGRSQECIGSLFGDAPSGHPTMSSQHQVESRSSEVKVMAWRRQGEKRARIVLPYGHCIRERRNLARLHRAALRAAGQRMDRRQGGVDFR
jgi:Pyridoxamine 5'-phosphate oxidase